MPLLLASLRGGSRFATAFLTGRLEISLSLIIRQDCSLLHLFLEALQRSFYAFIFRNSYVQTLLLVMVTTSM